MVWAWLESRAFWMSAISVVVFLWIVLSTLSVSTCFFLALGARGRLVRPLELPLGSEVASFSPFDISILLYTLQSIWIDCSVMRGLKATLWVHFIEKTTPRPLDVPQKINKHNTVY